MEHFTTYLLNGTKIKTYLMFCIFFLITVMRDIGTDAGAHVEA